MISKNLEKHFKYEKYYKANDLYWGLGIENEFYLEFDNKIQFNKDKFISNHKPERYSVDYYKIYDTRILEDSFQKIDYEGFLPLLMNSHSFSKTDKNNQPKFLSDGKTLNPNFTGETLWELIQKENKYIKDSYGNNLIFDGDSIELITVNFYNTKYEDVIDEYISSKKLLIDNIQNVFEKNKIFEKYGKIRFMTKNHPYAIMMTNINNVCMFNNGTLHFNITLPTELDENRKIKNRHKFTMEHKNYIKLIQFMEPLFIAIFGESDPLAEIDSRLSFGTQRGAVSRYIGIGTYDVRKMEVGKRLQEDVINVEINKEHGWFNKYYSTCGYKKLDKIGYDINYNKHYNHGVEIRFFEHQTCVENIKNILKMLIYLGDFSLENTIENNPIQMIDWNNLVLDCIKFGKNTRIKSDIFDKVFKYKFYSTNAISLYNEIFDFLEEKFLDDGKFSKLCFLNKNQDINKQLANINSNIMNELNSIKIGIKSDMETQKKQLQNQMDSIKNSINNKMDETKTYVNNVATNNLAQVVSQLTGLKVQVNNVSINKETPKKIIKSVANEENKIVARVGEPIRQPNDSRCCTIL